LELRLLKINKLMHFRIHIQGAVRIVAMVSEAISSKLIKDIFLIDKQTRFMICTLM